MNKLSAIVIAKNEENRIADCLDSLSFCDEIIVVDNDSKDRTAEVAQRLGAKIVKSNDDNFSNLRNLGLRRATYDFVFYVDADERVDSNLRENIKQVLKSASPTDFYKVSRKNFYLGNNEWPKIEKMERLFRKSQLRGWKGELHESPQINGESEQLNGFLLHYTHRNLSEMLKKTILWSKTEAELRYNARHPKMTWWRFPRVMITTFFDYYIRQEGYKIGTAGLVESMYQAFSIFVTYARLWELQNAKDRND